MSERSTGRPVPDGAAIGERAGGAATGHRDVPGAFILLGSPAYRRAAAAMGASGFATFALLYCVQPLMPLFSVAFRVTPAVSSLSLSVATAVMTVSIFAAGILSERFGRKNVMAGSLFGSAVVNLLAAGAPDWHTLLALRLLEGVVAGGVPAVAMTYLAEEMHPAGLGFAMGLYVAGNAFGGMTGRLIAGFVADDAGWRAAMAVLSLLGLAASIAFVVLLPRSRNFRPAPGGGFAFHTSLFATLLRRPAILLLMAVAVLLVGPFVTVYDYAGYRLIAPPYRLDQTELGLIFGVYVFGMAGSAVCGRLADRLGRGRVLLGAASLLTAGLLLTAARPLPLVVVGIAVLTFGFFGAHVVASAWVGRVGRDGKGHASALYLFAFYGGMSVLGSLGGTVWQAGGWPAVATFAVALSLGAVAAAAALIRVGA